VKELDSYMEDREDLDEEQLELKKEQDIFNKVVEMKKFFVGLSDEDLADEDLHYAIEELTQEFYSLRYGDYYEDHMASLRAASEREYAEIDGLKPQIQSGFQLPDGCPPLPFQNPKDTLLGVGIGYDEDHDDRVIVAAAKLSNYFSEMKGGNYIGIHDIVAIREHEGSLNIFTLNPITQTYGDMADIEVCGDTWNVTQYVPCGPLGWIAMTPKYIWNCVQEALDRNRKDFDLSVQGNPVNDATRKQLNFLRGLGYTGPSEITKSEASDLIDEYKNKKQDINDES